MTGVATAVGDEGRELLPETHSLEQDYPNPFNPSTSISYSLPERGLVRIEVMNLLGQKVKTLVDQVQSAGNHSVEWDGANDEGESVANDEGESVANGVYLYRITAGDFTDTKKMILLK